MEGISLADIFNVRNLVIYLVAINLIAFVTMFIDKKKAQNGTWRIKEMTLFTLVLLGGGIGGIAGMYTFRHKTKKWYFKIGFPVILISEIILAICCIFWF